MGGERHLFSRSWCLKQLLSVFVFSESDASGCKIGLSCIRTSHLWKSVALLEEAKVGNRFGVLLL